MVAIERNSPVQTAGSPPPGPESAILAPTKAAPAALPDLPKRPESWGPFLYKEDRLPTAVVAAGVALSLAPFLVPMSAGTIACLLPVALAARVMAPVHQHHHAHLKVFTNRWLNKLYDTVLMLGGGNVTTGWEMQHCRGHHTQYLDHEKDVAGSMRFTKSGPFRRIIYTVLGDASSLRDAWKIAGQSRDPGKVRRRLAGEVALQVAVNGALLAINPPLALATIILPNVLLRWMVFWKSFDQHDAAPGNDVYDGSVNVSGRIQELFLNVGHHTAHHKKPTLHWSRLPELTDQIKDKIPTVLMR